MKKNKIVEKWISDLVDNGFMVGWGGDRSQQFRIEQYNAMMKVLGGDVKVIGGNYRLLATIYSDYGNLKQYCKWNEKQLKDLLKLFGFENIEQVMGVMSHKEINTFMENSKLKKEVVFHLTPKIY